MSYFRFLDARGIWSCGLLLFLSLVNVAAHAGKPGRGGNPPSPSLPPARYALTWIDGGTGWEIVMPRDMNNFGQIAGIAWSSATQNSTPNSAVAYNSLSDLTINLNQLGAEWLDLNSPNHESASTSEWHASEAFGINDAGVIVGTAIKDGQSARSFILENAFGPAQPRFLLLPTAAIGDHFGRRVNNFGEAVGVSSELGQVVRYQPVVGGGWPLYSAISEPISTVGTVDINDSGVVVSRGSGFTSRQLSSGMVPDVFSGYEFWSISNGTTPMISGSRESTKGKRGQAGGPIRLPILGTSSEVQLLYAGQVGNYSRAINDDGDACFEAAQASLKSFLFYDAINPNTNKRYGVDGDGVLPLSDMVITQDADWVNDQGGMRLDGVNNRGLSGLGQICGFAYGSQRGFLLSPYISAD